MFSYGQGSYGRSLKFIIFRFIPYPNISVDIGVMLFLITLLTVFSYKSQQIRGKDPNQVACDICLNPEDSNHVDVEYVVNRFMRRYKVPGSSLALVKDGRVVYSAGFGVMDVSTNSPVQASSLFRIASLSKPIT